MTNPLFFSNEDLILQLRAGNQLALKQLHTDYEVRLLYFVNRLVQHLPDSEEIVSEVFMKCWLLRANFETIENVTAFLYVSCRNAAYDCLRRQSGKKGRLEVPTEHLPDQPADSEGQSILHQLIETELLHQIFEQIEALPPMRKKVLQLTYIEGLTTKEVAKILNLNEQNVRNTKIQALEQLRNLVIKRHIISLLPVLLLAAYASLSP